MCENGICSAVERGGKKIILEYAVYQQYRHCDVFASNSLCVTPLFIVHENFTSQIYTFHQFNCVVLTFYRVFFSCVQAQSPAKYSLPSLLHVLLSVQCHACTSIQTAEALDRRREEG